MRYRSLTPCVGVVELPRQPWRDEAPALELRVGWGDGCVPTHAAWVVGETGRIVKRVEVGVV